MVGIHGAGLAGMIAMPPGSSVVELRLKNANLRDNHFVFLSGAMGHKYLQVFFSFFLFLLYFLILMLIQSSGEIFPPSDFGRPYGTPMGYNRDTDSN